MSIEINITDNIVQVTPTEQQVDINITENPIQVNVTDQIVLIAQTGLPGPAGEGVPVGGTAGQILAKNSSTNYDTLWINNAVGTVTSINASGVSGISVSGGPITSSGTLLITNTAPDQIVSLTGTGTTSISGTYPSFTINSADQYSGTVTSVGTSAPLTGGTITSSGTIGITQSSASGDGYLSSTDWTTFNNKQNALTNPITGTGTINYVPKFTGASALSDSNIQDSGSLITLGTALQATSTAIFNNSMALGTSLIANSNFYITKQIGGGTFADGLTMTSAVGSGVSSVARYLNVSTSTVSGINLTELIGYNARQGGTFLSPVVSQFGFSVESTMSGATNNYAFRGNINASTNNWNFYAGGTAKNYFNGTLLIGTTSDTGLYKLDVNGTTRLNGVTTIGTINAATTDTDRFLVSDSGVVKFRTGSQVLSDIGGQGALTLTTTGTSGAATLIGNTLNVPQYEAEGNYVTTATTITINGVTYDLSVNRSWSVGTVTSVGLSMPVAFSVANTPITSSGTLAVTAVGNSSQYIRGDGQLATLPSGSSGGSSVNYYLNGSVAASVAGYQQMSNSAVIGAGTDFTLVGNGLIAQFLTDVANPNRLLIPGGAWNFEMYFNVSSSGGNAKFYVELLKYDGTTFTSIASSSVVPEQITGGTTIDLYITSLAVPETVLLTSDRLAIRVYIVDNSGGRTARLHTENSHLCEIITTFAGGIAALNGLTSNTQYLAVGTSGTDFAISSVTDTHTFNLPTASATNRGALSSADWTTFNNKPSVNIYTGDGTLTGNRIVNNDIYSLTFNGGFNIKHNTQSALFSTFYGAGSGGLNIFIGGGGLSSGTGGGASSNGSYNTAVGVDALLSNTTGYQNIANGYNALYSNTTGYQNTGNGVDTLFNNTTGYQNIANGYNALYFNTTGYQNTANGANALRNNTTGYQNIANGYNALNSNTTGNNNTANGVGALLNNTTGICNSSVGASSLRSNTTGSNNIALGFNAGRFIADLPSANTITNNSIFIGYDTKAAENNQTNQIVIGYEETGLGSNTTIIGNASTVTTALRGRLLLGTTTDNGVNKLQVTGTALFSSSVTASSLIKSGGTSTQFLKADGSVDSTSYGTFTLPSLTAGSVLFSNGTTIAQDNANFFWDDTNNRLGIGTTTPASPLQVHRTTASTDVRIALTDATTTNAVNRGFNIIKGSDQNGYIYNYENFNVIFGTNATERMRITSGGNVGIGVTPSAGWASDANNKVIQLAGGSVWTYSTSQMSIAQNMLYNGANNVYVNNGEASYYRQRTSQHEWHIAPSGTAGNTITFTQAMTLNASGNLGIGETSPTSMLHFSKQTVWGTANNRVININNTGIGGDINVPHNMGSITWYSGNSTPTAEIAAYRNTPASGNNIELRFYTMPNTSPTERMRITAGGNILMGTTSDNTIDRLQVSGSTKITGKLDIDSGSLSTSTNVYNNGDFISNWIGNSTVQLFSIRNNSTSGVYLNTQNSNTLYLGVSAATTGGTTVNHLSIASTGAATFSSSVTATNFYSSGGFYTAGFTIPASAKGVISNTNYGGPAWNNASFVTGNGATGVMFGGDTASYTYGWLQGVQTDNTGNIKNLSINPLGGNVLIGTTTDNGTDRLQVSGTVYATGTTRLYDAVYSGTSNANGLRINQQFAGGSNFNVFSLIYVINKGNNPYMTFNNGTSDVFTLANSGAATFSSSVTAASYTVNDAGNISVGTTTGTKIGTATSQKLSFWNATPIIQPTTSIAESAFVENLGGSIVNVDSTFDGYTIQQIAKALRNAGLLA